MGAGRSARDESTSSVSPAEWLSMDSIQNSYRCIDVLHASHRPLFSYMHKLWIFELA